jgi:hypothetical protein
MLLLCLIVVCAMVHLIIYFSCSLNIRKKKVQAQDKFMLMDLTILGTILGSTA